MSAELKAPGLSRFGSSGSTELGHVTDIKHGLRPTWPSLTLFAAYTGVATSGSS